MFAVLATSDFRVGGPTVEVCARSLQFHVPLLTRGEVSRLGRSELFSVGKMDLDSHARQGFMGGVLDSTLEGVCIGIVSQYQPSTVSDLIESLVQSEESTGFFTLLAFMNVNVFFPPFSSSKPSLVAIRRPRKRGEPWPRKE
jgi:hypothetical protein